MKSSFLSVFLFLLTFCAQVLSGPVVDVVLTGDSMTVNGPGPNQHGYEDEFASLIASNSMFTSSVVGRGGLTADEYADLGYDDSVINNVPAPDVIVLMIGVNDALKNNTTSDPGRAERVYERFTHGLGGTGQAFDTFDTSTTASRVIVLSILPVNESQLGWLSSSGRDGPGTNLRITGNGTNTTDETSVTFGYNPWLQKEVADRNADSVDGPVYEYVDLHSTFDMSLLDTDGLHLTDMNPANDPFGPGGGALGNGQQWLAERALASVTAVPEPSSFFALGLFALGVLVIRRSSGI